MTDKRQRNARVSPSPLKARDSINPTSSRGRNGKLQLDERVKKRLEGFSPQSESCTNIWYGACVNTDIALYILHEERCLPICQSCWIAIAAGDIQWG